MGRHVEFLRAEASGVLPAVEVGDDDGYAGLDAEQAALRFAGAAVTLALQAAPASEVLAERARFIAQIDALSASRAVPTGRGVARVSPDTSGAGLARHDGRA